MKKKKKLKNTVWKNGKYWIALCLDVDVSSFGKSKKEALAKLDEALDLYFEDKKENTFEPIIEDVKINPIIPNEDCCAVFKAVIRKIDEHEELILNGIKTMENVQKNILKIIEKHFKKDDKKAKKHS